MKETEINIKGKKYLLSEEIIKDMDSMIRKGGIELGFPLCSFNGKIIKGDKCQGDACSIKIDSNCPEGSKLIGTFHTHPGSSSLPSLADLTLTLNWYLRDKSFGLECRGGELDNIIRCDIVNTNLKSGINVLLETYDEMTRLNFSNSQLNADNFEISKLFEKVEIVRTEKEITKGEKIPATWQYIDHINKNDIVKIAKGIGINNVSSLSKSKLVNLIEKSGYKFMIQSFTKDGKSMFSIEIEKQ